jgi:putative two-component system response regulator
MNVFPANILVVDDTPTNIALVKSIFEKEGCRIVAAENGKDALEKAENTSFDLILLDVMMPVMDGFEACERLKKQERTKEIPVIFLTAMSEIEQVKHGFEVGGVDYVVKPFNRTELLARVRTHLELKKYREQEIEQTQKDIIFTLAYVGELRSKDTGNHTKRVSEYSGLLGELYGLTPDAVEMLKLASAMHDIGKVAIPDKILNKPSALNEEERKIMNYHTQWGYHIFSRSKRPILQAAAVVAAQHHERFDGTGYPKGTKGEQIHIFGRIVALADVFDALLTKRSYKEEWRINKALAYITEESGKHFDPRLVELFVDNFGLFLEIRQKLKD